MQRKIKSLFKIEIEDYINQNRERIIKSCNYLSEENFWWSPNENTNSVGNLLLHLEGNIRQYIISGLGKMNDVRERDTEFEQKGLPKEEVLSMLLSTIDESIAIIKALPEKTLLQDHNIQGFSLSGINVLIHITEHLSYHTGQIALLTKIQRNTDLKFYGNQNLNQTNN